MTTYYRIEEMVFYPIDDKYQQDANQFLQSWLLKPQAEDEY